ncbi:MAG: hypothetical protein HOI65_04915 [Opitutae bacterium]|nr:hypothetical protein [Opitutae bacterium]
MRIGIMELNSRFCIILGILCLLRAIGIPTIYSQAIRISDGTVFNKVILPVLQEKCMKCHGPTKAKGKLRLHTMEHVRAVDGLAIAGNLEESDLVYRITLPLNDPDDEKMPPSDEANQLSLDEIWLIKWWIVNGASYDLKLSEVQNTDDARQPLLRTLRHYAIFPPGTSSLKIEKEHEEATPTQKSPTEVATAQSGPRKWGSIYEEVIDPILEHNCGKCHGDGRASAKLRLHNPEGIQAGGKNGAVLVSGNPKGSLMMQRIHLSSGDDDRMPPTEENRQLTANDKNILNWWIQSGAKFDQPLGSAPGGLVPAMKEIIAAADARKNAPQPGIKGPTVRAASGDALQMVKDFGVNVVEVTKGSNALAVHCDDMASEINDEGLRTISLIGEQVLWLNLAKTKVTNKGLDILTKFPELRRLHLDRTQITDVGLSQVAKLGKLEYLNLYNTNITDAGLQKLVAIPTIQKIFAGKTQITQGGVTQAMAARPGLEINAGFIDIPAETTPGGIGSIVGAASNNNAQVDPRPVNSKCPVSGLPVDPVRSTVYNKMTIAFGNGQALAKFNDNPSQYINKLVITRQPDGGRIPTAQIKAPPGTPDFGREPKAFMKEYCGNCHMGGSSKGGVALGRYENSTDVLRDRKTWNQVIALIKEKEMPPSNRPQPSPAEAKKFTELIQSIFNHAKKNSESGTKPGIVMASSKMNLGPRTWTNTTGRSLQGKLFAVNGTTAVINVGGVNYKVPVNSLSAADQQYIKEWKSAKGI